MPTEKTTAAFYAFRTGRPAKKLSAALVSNADQIKQMAEADGLLLWQDGVAEGGPSQAPKEPPTFTAKDDTEKMLWVVREADVPYALEACPFGKGLESGMIKHSNLTGGEAAYSGGELLIV